MQLLLEATVVGIIIVIIGLIVGFLVGPMLSVDLPKICEEWNQNHAMEISLFLTGFLGHLALEATGVNKWYCENGNACK